MQNNLPFFSGTSSDLIVVLRDVLAHFDCVAKALSEQEKSVKAPSVSTADCRQACKTRTEP